MGGAVFISQISVIVPVYKVEPYLRRCVDSILGQTFTDFELILVDDGSPDKCPDICDEYAQKDNRVHVIHQENGGLSVARNAGIDWAFTNSDSRWLSFVDSDDWVHPELLQSLYNAVIQNNVNIAVCGYIETSGQVLKIQQAKLTFQLWYPEDFYIENNGNAVIACGKIYRKSCFDSIRFPEGRVHEDEFTTYRVLFACTQIAATAEPMYFFFRNPEGITKSGWTPKKIDKLDALDEQADFFKANGFMRVYDMIAHWHIALLIRECESVRHAKLSKSEKSSINRKLRKSLKETLIKRQSFALYVHAAKVYIKTTYIYRFISRLKQQISKLI